jgi:M-phase inducer tyrosine phosphatase
MDVDSPYQVPTASIPTLPFNNQNFDRQVAGPPLKRHSSEVEHTLSLSSDNEPPSSPSNRCTRKLERFASSGVVFTKDGKKPRRPALSSILPTTQEREPAQSAYPILTQTNGASRPIHAQPPVRRAFSAVVPPTLAPDLTLDLSSDESFVNSSPAAAYADRNNQRVLRRKDGREEFRPKLGAGAVQLQMNPSPAVTSMPAFGAEAYGKILPCTAVTEDGLMRIDSTTVGPTALDLEET